MSQENDSIFMQKALDLAGQGLGRVAPNPSVGCIIVKDGRIIGQARTADGGRPHAETQALEQAGEQAAGATLYVTLEPCANHGKTKPCIDSLIKSGVSRVVIACRDPVQEVHGGLDKLDAAGIEVTLGVCEQHARALNEGFFKVINQKRPMVTVKIATTLDGRIATNTGESQWITGESSRTKSHEFREQHDAVLVGVGTVLADNPLLTVRLEGCNHQPVRIVIDRDFKTPMDSKLVKSARDSSVWIVSEKYTQAPMKVDGVEIIPMKADSDGHFDIAAMLEKLANKGITRLFVEGGGATISWFLKAGAVDRIIWFRAPKLIGGDGIPAIQALGIDSLADSLNLTLESREILGDDSLEIWNIER